jgi:hypothetical protein
MQNLKRKQKQMTEEKRPSLMIATPIYGGDILQSGGNLK